MDDFAKILVTFRSLLHLLSKEPEMLEIVWRNPRELIPKNLTVSKLVSCDVSDFELWSLYRSISDGDQAEVYYELLVYESDPPCAA